MWWLPSVLDSSKPKPLTRFTISENLIFLELPIIFLSNFRLFIFHILLAEQVILKFPDNSTTHGNIQGSMQ